MEFREGRRYVRAFGEFAADYSRREGAGRGT